jgi:hypothetical protein
MILQATRLIRRVAIALAADQYEYASRNGEDRQNRTEATNTQKRYYAPDDEKDGQQQESDVSIDMHESLLSFFFVVLHPFNHVTKGQHNKSDYYQPESVSGKSGDGPKISQYPNYHEDHSNPKCYNLRCTEFHDFFSFCDS